MLYARAVKESWMVDNCTRPVGFEKDLTFYMIRFSLNAHKMGISGENVFWEIVINYTHSGGEGIIEIVQFDHLL